MLVKDKKYGEITGKAVVCTWEQEHHGVMAATAKQKNKITTCHLMESARHKGRKRIFGKRWQGGENCCSGCRLLTARCLFSAMIPGSITQRKN